MEINDLYDVFVLLIIAFGFVAGMFLLTRAVANRRHVLRAIILAMMAATKFAIVAIYVAVLFGLPAAVPSVFTAGLLIRVVLPFLIGLPAILVRLEGI